MPLSEKNERVLLYHTSLCIMKIKENKKNSMHLHGMKNRVKLGKEPMGSFVCVWGGINYKI